MLGGATVRALIAPVALHREVDLHGLACGLARPPSVLGVYNLKNLVDVFRSAEFSALPLAIIFVMVTK
jgi:hypothetical protein